MEGMFILQIHLRVQSMRREWIFFKSLLLLVDSFSTAIHLSKPLKLCHECND
jgi:hypothetical protein